MSITKSQNKPKILVVCNYYLPGYKGGGSLRTIVNMVERLGDRFDFRIITRDHDGDRIPFENVAINNWNKVGNAQVFYLSVDNIKISKLRELIKKVQPDAIYINSVFATLSIFILLLKKFSLLPETKIILAPEGEISEGALKLKSGKKTAFLKLAKTLGLHRNLIWKTTSEYEKREAERIKGRGGQIFIAPNLTAKTFLENYRQELKPKKKVGEVRMIFLSRFMRKKNFNWLLSFLGAIEGQLSIDIYGNLEDGNYWAETREMIKALPANISVVYRGSIPHEQVAATIFDYHFFILPTLGENFGHVFVEALAAGCPLIISDRTPWRNLREKMIGWEIPLEDVQGWIHIINECLSLDDETYSRLSSNSRDFAVEWLESLETEENTLSVLKASL